MTRRLLAPAAAAILLLPGLALAAAEPSGGGMPQLRFNDPLMIAQIVWLLIIFGLLYHVLSAYALPRVGEVLDDRARRIAADLEAAQAAKDAADAAAAERRAAAAKASADAQARIADAAQQAQAAAAAQMATLNARLATQLEAAEAQIAAAREAARNALQRVATDTTEALVARLMGPVERPALEAAVASELASRGRA